MRSARRPSFFLTLTASAVFVACTPPADDPVPVVIDVGVDADASLDASTMPDATNAEDTARSDLRDVSEVGEAFPPSELTRWLSGNAADADATPLGPGLILMGGGREPDEAFLWWGPLVAGGDVVVVRESGADGYNDYLFEEIGGVDSVETLLVDSPELANAPYVAQQVDRAEAVFIAGGNQWNYLSWWADSELQRALNRVWARGGVIGGTSAGLAVLGDRAFSAENDTVYSEEALADPFNEFMRFEDDFLDLPPLTNAITDSHFAERDRMGRLVAFVARMWTDGVADAWGIGVDEGTALLLGPDGERVVGAGNVYEVRPDHAPERCLSGETLDWTGVSVRRRGSAGETGYSLEVSDGALIPATPY